jgi:hypothetical protein
MISDSKAYISGHAKVGLLGCGFLGFLAFFAEFTSVLMSMVPHRTQRVSNSPVSDSSIIFPKPFKILILTNYFVIFYICHHWNTVPIVPLQ